MFNKREKDPILDQINDVLQKGQLQADIIECLNEAYGVSSKKQLPIELQKEFDAKVQTILEAIEQNGQIQELNKSTLASYVRRVHGSNHKTSQLIKEEEIDEDWSGFDEETINEERKNTEAAVKALLNKTRYKGKRDHVENGVWKQHGNEIARHDDDGTIIATHAGWNTVTTRSRLNALSRAVGGPNIYQHKHNLYYGDQEISPRDIIILRRGKGGEIKEDAHTATTQSGKRKPDREAILKMLRKKSLRDFRYGDTKKVSTAKTSLENLQNQKDINEAVKKGQWVTGFTPSSTQSYFTTAKKPSRALNIVMKKLEKTGAKEYGAALEFANKPSTLDYWLYKKKKQNPQGEFDFDKKKLDEGDEPSKLNEISSDTLGRYIKKASFTSTVNRIVGRKKPLERSSVEKLIDRDKYIGKATDKLVKRARENDDNNEKSGSSISSDTLGRYIKKASFDSTVNRITGKYPPEWSSVEKLIDRDKYVGKATDKLVKRARKNDE